VVLVAALLTYPWVTLTVFSGGYLVAILALFFKGFRDPSTS
jgi:hypothetical protein